MRLISFEEADPLLDWNKMTEALMDGHRYPKAKIGDLLLQDEPNSLLSRGAWIPGLGMALKSMSVFPNNNNLSPPLPSIQGGVLLFEGDTGSLSAVIDGILVTKWKTAGDSVLGAKLLSNPEPKSHLIVGAGTVAASIIEAYHAVFPSIERFEIWNRTTGRATSLATQLSEKISAQITLAPDLASACANADIITTATMSKDPILKGNMVSKGTHVDLIGAFKPDMREADDDLLQKSRLFVDSRETTIGHIGEIQIPLNEGTLTKDDILGDFYEICAGKAGRNSQDDITLFKNGGGAHLDLMTSMYIYNAI